MKTIKTIAAFVMVSTLTGCASIAGDNTRKVAVNSSPAGAAVYVDNQRYGTTPTTVNLPTYIYGGKTVTLKKKGYQDQSVNVNTSFQPVALLDLLLWPTLLVDAATGNLVKIDPADRMLDSKLAVV